MVVSEVVETRNTIKFCVKFGYKPTEMFNLLQRGGDALKTAFMMALEANAGR